jgi:hypothetical protein
MTFSNVSETFGAGLAGLETRDSVSLRSLRSHARVRIVHDPDSLLEGEVDEAANRAAFAEALRSWRGGEAFASSSSDATTRREFQENQENPPAFSEPGGSLLDGAFDEAANRRAFAEALGEWRGEDRQKKKSGEPNVPAMETQTESPPGARKTRAAPAKPSAPPGASYFERLRAGNVERLAGKDAADAVRSSSSKQCRQ